MEVVKYWAKFTGYVLLICVVTVIGYIFYGIYLVADFLAKILPLVLDKFEEWGMRLTSARKRLTK